MKNKTSNTLSIDKEALKTSILYHLKHHGAKTLENATNQDLYEATSLALKDVIMEQWLATKQTYEKQDTKQMYYLSMEFLMGRAFSNNMISLGAEKAVKEIYEELNIDINAIEDVETDAGLGNGGLGRLAACFLDSLAALELPGHGAGIKYRYGLFKQRIVDGYQIEQPDSWFNTGEVWLVKRPEDSVEVKFGGYVQISHDASGNEVFEHKNTQSVLAVPYDMPVVGYSNNTINTLRLWDAEAINEFDLKSFEKGNYNNAVAEQNLAETITKVLYPADDHYHGKELRLKQQYFFVSATIQTVLKNFLKKHDDLKTLPQKVAFQLNDTHPAMAVAELMRVLVDEYKLDWDTAWDITTHTCAYTNHTIMSEALEKWPIDLFSNLLPRVYQVAEEINRRFCLDLINRGYDQEKIRKMAIIADGQIRMAWLAIVGSHSVNGVAALHTEILKNEELKDFYVLYPEKFNNKTNGITQRRWLLQSNPELASLITEKIGDAWTTKLDELKKLEKYADDKTFRKIFRDIKFRNKERLAAYIKEHNGIDVDPNSVFDIQIKRLHEYKRQLLNALHIIALYNRIKANPSMDITPRTFIFGAKAAPGYRRAKLIIKLINNIANLVNNDKDVAGRIKVVFIENYRVSVAEKLFPAADVSEQISTASKEASGTGNMKFMLNGALTLGTMDGANVEIVEEAGKENAFIFGLSADEVISFYANGGYNPWDIYNNDAEVRQVLNQLINGFLSPEDPELFREIYDSLLHGNAPDEYFVLKDFRSYSDSQLAIDKAYRDQEDWSKMAILNVANAGKFSSDRTISQYATEIWNIKPTKVTL